MYKLLIVEDEGLIREGLNYLIDWDEYGIEIVGEAINGKHGIELVEQLHPDIIITDIKMPVMNGLDMIKYLRRENPTIKIIVTSGYDDFQFVREALVQGVENYLLKPVKDTELASTILAVLEKLEKEEVLEDSLTVNMDVIKENILYRLITNNIDIKELKEKSFLVDMDINASVFQVGIIKILSIDTKTNIKNSILKRLNVVKCDDVKFNNFINLKGEVCSIFYGDNFEMINGYCEIFMKSAVDLISKELNLDTFGSIGEPYEDILNLYLSYESAQALQDYRYIYPVNSVLSYFSIEQNVQYIGNLDLKRSLLNSIILAGDIDAVNRYFNDIKEQLIKLKALSIIYVYHLSIELITVLMDIANVQKITIENMLENYNDFYKQLLNQNDVSNTMDLLNESAINLTMQVIDNKKRPETFIEQVLNYINENYTEDISLKTLSYKFNISAAYLGQLFKSETSKVFTDYLNELRINVAKKMLVETKLGANDVAIKVGYRDPNYFYKVFKKYCGVYPSEFSRKC